MKTLLCERLGIDVPIIQAPMGGAVGPPLAAAVSNAGGLGMLVPWRADMDTVRRVMRLVDRAEYKRQQAAPGLKISPKAFGYGRRFPIAAKSEV